MSEEEYQEELVDEGLSEEDTPEDQTSDEDQESTASPEEEQQDTERKLLAGKYTTPEELEKGYKEVESKLGKYSQEYKELRDQYNQLMQKIQWSQQQQQQQGQEDLTDEEKMQQKLQQLEAFAIHTQNERIYNQYLDQNEDMKAERDLFDSYVAHERLTNPSGSPQQWLDAGAERARKYLSRIKDSARRETSETRREVQSQQSPKGKARQQVDTGPKGQTADEYLASRMQTNERTKRTY